MNLNDTIWKKSDKKISILNPADFEIPSFIRNLDDRFGIKIDGLGITDKEQITNRLDVMRMLMDGKIQDKISGFSDFFSKSQRLPSNENDFLYYYDHNENPYWKKIKEFIKVLKPYENKSAQIKGFLEYLNNSLPMEAEENNFAVEISHKLKDVTFLEGVIRLNIPGKYERDDRLVSSTVVGKKAYRSTWANDYIANVPKWTKSSFMKFIGAKTFIQKLANGFANTRAKRASVVLDMPNCVITDIEKYLYSDNIYNVLQDYTNYTFSIHFEYTKDGLKFDVIGVESKISNTDFKFYYQTYAGFTKMEKMMIAKKAKEINSEYNRSRMIKGLQKVYDELQRKLNLFDKKFVIDSPDTDRLFRWYALTNIYEENGEIVSKLRNHRKFVYDNARMLDSLSSVVEYMQNVARERKLDICIPEITEPGTGTEFSNLAPIELFDKKPEIRLVPFTLPKINGHILCLTGRHGGGKSVTGKSVISNVWIAQSGLPVFAKEFKTEIKTVIGSIINDNGEGSTANVYMDKVLNVFRGIDEVPSGQSIIFIDEIGKGTQETSGINLGKRILNTVKEKGYSLIFNSQILALAEYAESELGAECYVVNKDHQFKKGIGGGQMEELLKEKGLDKYLSK